MNFDNQTALPAAWTLGFRRDGRELLVVIVKATYTLPMLGEAPTLASEHVPLVGADVFNGEPGFSAPRFESDFAHGKPACDVILLGSAYAPHRKQAQRCQVGLRVGSMTKQFAVVGARIWHRRVGKVSSTAPKPFAIVPLSYDIAWGGTDRTREADGLTDECSLNPVGRGYWRHREQIDGQPLPQTEAIGEPIESPGGAYLPQAFSPIGRNWMPRRRYAGTYDAAWLESTAPLWPDDFDERYFQAAPADQSVPYPTGGESVVLTNLTSDGQRSFQLPIHAMPVTFIPHAGRDLVRLANIDTLVFEPDSNRFTMTFRCILPLARSMFDVKDVIAGDLPEAWHRARRFPGKTYHVNLADAVRASSNRRSAR